MAKQGNKAPEDLPSGELLESDLLSVFARVAQARNFSKAASHLGVAQPIVTRKIKRLEDELGVQLFVRSNRGCELTMEGELLAQKASGILLQLAQLKEEVSSSAARVGGTIAIGLPAAAGSLLAPQLMPVVAEQWPALRVELIETVTRNLISSVQSRELSLALVYDPPTDAGLLLRPLLMERLHCVCDPQLAQKHGLAGKKRLKVQELDGLPLVLPIRSQIIRVLLEDAFAEARLPLQPRYEANSPLLLKTMVLQGLGFTALSLGSVAAEVASGRLLAIPFADRGMSLALTLATTRDQARLRVVQLMSDLIASMVQSMVRKGQWPGSPQVMKA